jgi:hypothetical protein
MDTRKEKGLLVAQVRRFFGFPKNEPVGDLLKMMAHHRLMICGGAISSVLTDKKVNDLDFYVYTAGMDALEARQALQDAHEWLRKFFRDGEVVTLNAVTFKRRGMGNKVYNAQLITRFHGTPAEIFDWFDYTITHGCWVPPGHPLSNDDEGGTFYFGERFLQDIAKRRLVYAGKSRYPICALHRAKKYMDRGYELPGSTIMHVALAVAQLNIRTYRDLKEQLMGIDTAFLYPLLSAQVDDALVDIPAFIEKAFTIIDTQLGLSDAEVDLEEGDDCAVV